MSNCKKEFVAIGLGCLLLSFQFSVAQATEPAQPLSPAPFYINGRAAGADSGEPLNDAKEVAACSALPGYQRVTDHAHGYSVCIPAGLAPDFSLSAVRSSFGAGPDRKSVV